MYHRVIDIDSDPQMLAVTENNFRAQMQFLKKRYTILSLKYLYEAIQKKNVPGKAIVITFDDGYADNLYNAKPVLKELNIPATVFVSTGLTEKKTEFWWDELERILLKHDSLPSKLDINVNGEHFSWPISPLGNFKNWNVLQTGNPTTNHLAYRELSAIMRTLDFESRQKILSELQNWAGINNIARSGYTCMTAQEISVLDEGGLIEIGGHTKNHIILSEQSNSQQIEEIVNNKKELESILNKSIYSFAYPYGTTNDYNDDTIKILKDAGYLCACSNFPGIINTETNCFELPRYLVRNWNDREFAQFCQNL